MNYKLAFETYWPVIEACKSLKGEMTLPETGEIVECDDCVKGVVEALSLAEKRLLVKKEVETIEVSTFKI
jgi:uncharacterized protein YkvS